MKTKPDQNKVDLKIKATTKTVETVCVDFKAPTVHAKYSKTAPTAPLKYTDASSLRNLIQETNFDVGYRKPEQKIWSRFKSLKLESAQFEAI